MAENIQGKRNGGFAVQKGGKATLPLSPDQKKEIMDALSQEAEAFGYSCHDGPRLTLEN
ncbi:MAG: hypothetical protein LBR82_05200 [Desulfovibrio sp.]|jgi:hypothetical protein|nr:hypothetical protein [Desulfovibrio sp.]